MATALDKELRRTVTVGDEPYTVAIDPEGLRLTGKGKRKPEVALRWRDLLSGEAALAVALNASLSKESSAVREAPAEQPADRAPRKAPRKRAG